MRGFIWSLTLLLSLLAGSAAAQLTLPPATSGWEATFFGEPTVALPLLQAAAVQHSASVGALAAEHKIAREDVQLARKDILTSLALVGTYNYGNQTGTLLNDPALGGVFQSASSLRHSVGMNFVMPLDRLVSRRNLIQRRVLRVEQTDLQRQDRELTLRQEVLRLYYDVLLAKKLLTLNQQAYVSAQIDHELAERKFREGQTSLSELSLVNNQYFQSAASQESAVSQYQTSFLLLEALVGGRIADLMTRK